MRHPPPATATLGLLFARELPSNVSDWSTVVALTPAAVEAARARQIRVGVIDDFLERRRLFTDTSAYLAWQLSWFRKLEAVVGTPAANVCRQLLKVPMDSLVVWSRLFDAAVGAHSGADVTYAGPAPARESGWHAGHLQFWPLLGDRPLAADLVPLAAGKHGRTAHRVTMEGEGTGGDRSAGRSAMLRSARRRLSGLRNVGVVPLLRRRGPATVLTWSGGYGIRDIAAADHRRLLLLERGEPVTSLMSLGIGGMHRVTDAVRVDVPTTVEPKLSPALTTLADAIDEWTSLPGAATLFGKRLAFYVDAVLPSVDRAAERIAPLLSRQRVQRVVAANPSSVEEFALLLAVQRSGVAVDSVLAQHGDHLFGYESWLLTETQNFKTLLWSDPTVPGAIERSATQLGAPTPNLAPRPPSPTRRAARRQTSSTPSICYVPTAFVGETSILPLLYLEDAWYQRWRAALASEFRSHRSMEFVWKGIPGSDQAKDPLPSSFEGSNIRLAVQPFTTLLPSVARVIIDFPSTPLYEAARAGVPTLCIWFEQFGELRSDAAELFGSVVRVVSSIDEALVEVRRFVLADDLRPWVAPAMRPTGST